MTRRTFIAVPTAALMQRGADAQVVEGGPSWTERPLRWAQLVFVEDDPGKYDPKFWLDYFARIHADAACLGAGGYMAFYPTAIPLHLRSRFLGDHDPFGDMVKGCRKLGMNVVARTDPHAAHQGIYDAHPDWIAVDAEGKKRRHWANPALWVTCALGPMNWDFMTEVHKEIVSLYGVDGIFSNRWSGHGQCFCEHCQRNFKSASGFDLPRTSDPHDPARRAYIEWREQRLFDLCRHWDKAMRSIKPDACFIPNSGGGATSDLDMRTLGAMVPTLFADRQARRGLTPPWAAGRNAKEYRAAMGRKPIAGITSVGVEEPYRWKDSVQSGPEIKLWMADGVAQGLRPWFVKFNAKLSDRRWLAPVEEFYRWHYANERYLRNETPLARVGLVYSQQTNTYFGSTENNTLGFYQALVEARIPFEMVHDRKLDDVGRFKTLLLPNIAALSDEQCKQIDAFVSGGGGLVATYQTSLFDEWGRRRNEFGLSQLFGVTDTRRGETRMQNSYLDLHHPHPLLAGLEGTTRIINGIARVEVNGTGPSPLTLLPTFPDLPMEDVYARVQGTDIPGVFARQHGKGRIVYFPFDLDRTYWEVMSPDHFLLLRNAVNWATNEAPVVTVDGPGVFDISVWRQKNSMTVHLVNLTNPMMMKGPVREVYPVGPLRVTLRPPSKPAGVKLLVAGQAAKTEGNLTVHVPRVGLHEVVALDL